MAFIRSAWVAVAAGVTAALTLYMSGIGTDIDLVLPGTQVDPMLLQKALITGILAGLAAVAVRGGAEGLYDGNRARTGNVSSADVPMASPDQTVIENDTGQAVAGQKMP